MMPIMIEETTRETATNCHRKPLLPDFSCVPSVPGLASITGTSTQTEPSVAGLLDSSAPEAHSVRNAVAGSCLAAFFEGMMPPISVSTTLRTTSATAPGTGSTPLTSFVPMK